ncbi:hypothetical protein IGI37_000119 [Enterococcus sp. AZ194]|uniref:hypothetical protein n=1 Tax=Enterococcus sp. AZ194 TaxID=2774629 RepID=UPI003F23D069
MINLIGTVDKIRVLKFTAQPLVRFTLMTDDGNINCLISLHSLSFLADVEDGMRVSIVGTYNRRKQFVIRKYCVIGKTKVMYEFENSIYPKIKVN